MVLLLYLKIKYYLKIISFFLHFYPINYLYTILSKNETWLILLSLFNLKTLNLFSPLLEVQISIFIPISS